MKTLTIGWDGKVEGKWANNRPCILSVFCFVLKSFSVGSYGAGGRQLNQSEAMQLTRSSPAQCKRLSLIGWRKEGRRGIKPMRAQLTRASSAQCTASSYVRLPLIGWRKGGTDEEPIGGRLSYLSYLKAEDTRLETEWTNIIPSMRGEMAGQAFNKR